MDIQALIQTLLQKIEQLEARVKILEAENTLFKNKKNSNNSQIPHLKIKTVPEKIKVDEHLQIEKQEVSSGMSAPPWSAVSRWMKA